MSSASSSLEAFLAQQAAIARRASPLTPPCEQSVQQKTPPSSAYGYATPQKVHPGMNMVNGYLTPPITPDGDSFLTHNDAKGYNQVPRCPVTPTPPGPSPLGANNNCMYVQQHQYASFPAENMSY